MKTISYYISMVVILAATIFTGVRTMMKSRCHLVPENFLSMICSEYRKRRYAVIDKR